MCGIAAQYGRPDHDAGRRMLERLVHRGPDDEGYVAVGDAWLGHRRLSIVDVEGGRPPLGGAPRGRPPPSRSAPVRATCGSWATARSTTTRRSAAGSSTRAF